MTDPLLPGPLWMVGCGHMGSAMLTGWLAAGVHPAHVTVIRPSGAPVAEGVRVLTDYPEDEVPAIVLLAMKPYQLDAVAPRLAPALDPRTILVSILAGVEAASLRARFAAPETIVKAMPNLPVALGKGVINLYAEGGAAADRNLATDLMMALGHAEWFEDEAAFQLAGVLTGAGPAFLFRFIEALGKGAAALGLPEDQALLLATAMVAGGGALAAASQDSAAELARKVASPNGTTEAGLKVLDADRALFDLVEATLAAARTRSVEMAAEARARN
ncbi:pyrroline-5-carboxylate reductase family protein [Sphingosinicella sp.]|uniref:pyrroline-5-carboxylate reductase family protein n=1 Tax=Sphingosinicella sp. TaxID=1917971 RepID=UPI004037E792